MPMFRALLVEKDDAGYRCELRELREEALPEGNVTVRVEYSTLNYKDALAITGRSPIVRKFPLIPGVDFAGVVEDSGDPHLVPGDRVVLTGFGVGETHSGGLAERARVPADWLVKLPTGMTTQQAMAFGTAGFTAMLSVMALERHAIAPDRGPILVTGAGGGVGGLAIHLLHRLGYAVIAATGRMHEAAYLKRLGATDVIDRATLASPGKPLAKAVWAGAIDNAGSHTLANACAGTKDDGVVVSCGLAQGMDFPASVAPFILRGVTLVGINSVNKSIADRETVWQRLSALPDPDIVSSMMETIPLSRAIDHAMRILDGQILGRLIVDTSG
jgi:acrylyl-CoA reductase (NADPH)